MQHSNTAGCILLKFYIKPQHTANVYNLLYVVSYRNSTSNHNNPRYLPNKKKLYLIEILHQTTTFCSMISVPQRCILSKFYIKPQHRVILFDRLEVVSYRNSTSNHNLPAAAQTQKSVVSYRNSTSNHNFLAINLYA